MKINRSVDDNMQKKVLKERIHDNSQKEYEK